MHKAKTQKALTVGYLGGSITEGAGASNASKTSYRALTTAFLRSHLAGVTVTEVNAAIAGTGSELGAFRCGTDLLSKNPDLVLVEFAVNGWSDQQQLREIAMEGIVRQVYAHNPHASVAFIYAVTKTMAASSHDTGSLPKTVTWHEKIAVHYQIPSINVGQVLWKYIQQGSGSWETLTTDSVYPNDAG